jgi:hypothetical protein
MTPHIYPDFNTLMNRTILTDVAKTEERKENKRKFLERKVQGVRSQRQKIFSQPSQRTQAPMLFCSPASASNQMQPSYQPKTTYQNQTYGKTQPNNTGQVTNNSKACFHCHETRHYVAICLYKNNPTVSTQSHTVNGLRPVVSGANWGFPRNNTNTTNNSQMVKKPQQSYGRAHVNHIHAQDAQTASGVVLVEFLVNSVLATVLFDSGASHSFITSSFAERHKIPTVLLKLPLITRTPGPDIKCHLGCLNVRIILSG